jgi:hypothetical protein
MRLHPACKKGPEELEKDECMVLSNHPYTGTVEKG